MDLQKYTKKQIENFKSSFWGFFAGRVRVMFLALLVIITWGVSSYISLPQETTPEIKVPIGIVTTVFPGANATDVEQLITDEIESEVEGLENLNVIQSVSSEGISNITVEFEASADLDESFRELRDAVDNAKSQLPDDAEDPVVIEADFSNQSIITFNLVGEFSYSQLSEYADILQDEIESISGVREVTISGKRDKEIQILVDQQKLEGFGLNLDNVIQAVQSYHVNLPIGGIVVDNLNYQVRLEGELAVAEEFKNIPITKRGEGSIFIRDIATVQEALSEETTISRLSLNGSEPKQTLSLSVFKRTGANIITTVDEAKARIAEIQGTTIPPKNELFIEVTNDQSQFIRKDFNSLANSALQTIILIFIVLFIALGFKEALIAGISIPLTFLVTFGFFSATGNTINNITLFGLVLGLGLLVDTAIVVMEGIHEALYEKKLTPIEAVYDTVTIYKIPLLSGTLTSIAAFFPMLLVSGITGQFFSYIPKTVTAVLSSSYLISILIAPAIAMIIMRNAHIKKPNPKSIGEKIKKYKNKGIGFIDNYYVRILKSSISTRISRGIWVAGMVIALALSFSLPALGLLPVSSFPLEDTDFFFINIDGSIGTKVEKMSESVKEVEQILTNDKRVINFVTNIGGGSASTGRVGAVSAAGSNTANITVNLKTGKNRGYASFDIIDEYKEKFKNITDVKVTIPEIRGGPPSGAPIEVRIFGEDSKTSEEIAKDMESILEELGATQIENTLSFGAGDYVIYPDQEKMNLYGLNTRSIAIQARNAIFGREAGDLIRNNEEIEVWVKYDWNNNPKPQNVSEVQNINIATPTGEYIPLKNLAEIKPEASLLSIDHRDTERIVSVRAEGGKGEEETPAKIAAKLKERINEYPKPDGYRIVLGGQDEDVAQSYRDLFVAQGIAILLIYIILVIQFNSFLQPFIIMLSLPMSLIGVFWGFFIFGLTLDIATFIGVVALSGIVVNDAIVLIDRINQNRKNGMLLDDAITEAGPARLQAIIITSITTIFGILPLSLSDAFWLGLGSAIIFGLIFSTMLTLVFMPVLYKMFEWKKEAKKLQKLSPEKAPSL